MTNFTDRIRIMRGLDFEYEARIAQTYEEYAELLEAIERRQEERAVELITLHIKDVHNGGGAFSASGLKPFLEHCR